MHKAKNNVFILVLLILIVSLAFVTATHNSHSKDNYSNQSNQSNQCENNLQDKKNCIEEKKNSFLDCKMAFKEDYGICEDDYKNCLNDVKNITNKNEAKDKRKQCLADYLECKKNVRNIMFECKKGAILVFKECKNTCEDDNGGNEDNICSSNIDCQEGFFCNKNSCGDLSGECVLKPVACIAIFDPVCGCDGITYGNECNARKEGISQNHTGFC